MKRFFFVVIFIVIVGSIILLVMGSKQQSGLGPVKRTKSFSEVNVSKKVNNNVGEIKHSKVKVIDNSILQKEWHSVTESVSDRIENFTDQLAIYSPALSNFFKSNLNSIIDVKFTRFLEDYRKNTIFLSRKELFLRLRECRHRIFTMLPAELVKMAKMNVIEDFSYKFIKENFGFIKECTAKVIYYSIKLFPPQHYEKILDKYNKGLPLLEDNNLMMKIPYVIIPMLYKVLLAQTVLDLDNFFQDKKLR